MRIDLPLCGLDSCRYSFDGNCISKPRYQGCEFAYFKRLEAADRLIVLPCKVGDTVWVCWFGNDETNSKPSVYDFTVETEPMCILVKDLWGIKFFATKEEAEAKLKELKGE
jgi:hypothetical protein